MIFNKKAKQIHIQKDRIRWNNLHRDSTTRARASRTIDRIDDMNGETYPNKELTVNNAEKVEPLMTQLEQWSILSNVLNYIQYDKHAKTYHSISIKYQCCK